MDIERERRAMARLRIVVWTGLLVSSLSCWYFAFRLFFWLLG